jgi:thiol-disulfide isomerase/thioredoxin
MEAFISSISAAGPCLNLPPHISFALTGTSALRRYVYAIVAVFAIAAIALYVIRWIPVHVGGQPPASLSKLVLEPQPKALPAAAFLGDGGERLSLATFRGRPVLLNLWATWCAPCVQELPALARLQHAIPGLTVLAVSEGRENAAEARAFLKAHGASALNVYVDSDHAFLAAMGAFGLPLSALIDAQGRERARAVGPAQWDAPEAIAWLRTFTRQE